MLYKVNWEDISEDIQLTWTNLWRQLFSLGNEHDHFCL